MGHNVDAMVRFLILILIGAFIWWLSWRVVKGFRRGSRALSAPYLEGLSSVCYGVSEIIGEAVEGLLNARFNTVFVRFEEGVARLEEIFARVGAHDRSWQELKGTVERELEEVRNRLYGYHKVFTEQQKALDRGDSVSARTLASQLQSELEALRRSASVWMKRLDETTNRLNN